MIKDKDSEGYRIAQDLVHWYAKEGMDGANARFESVLNLAKKNGKQIPYWLHLAIADTFLALIKQDAA